MKVEDGSCVEVASLGDMASPDEAREQLEAYSKELHKRAANAHAEGMALERSSARVSQLAQIATDEMALRVRDAFVGEGCLAILPCVMMSEGGEA